jgi:hypothetical protein
MADQAPRTLTDIEKEAAFSYREWPIYIVMRLKRLQAIQDRLRVGGDTPSAMLRRDELLKAVYDMEAEAEISDAEVEDAADYIPYEAEPESPKPAPKKTSGAGSTSAGEAVKAKPAKATQTDDSDYLDDVAYDE